jgi:hypothetical protein
VIDGGPPQGRNCSAWKRDYKAQRLRRAARSAAGWRGECRPAPRASVSANGSASAASGSEGGRGRFRWWARSIGAQARVKGRRRRAG